MRFHSTAAGRLILLGALVPAVAAPGSCRLPGPGADKSESSEPDAPHPRETGGCENENVEGVCRYHSVQRLNPEHAPGPPGTVLCRISHEIVEGDRSIVVTSGYLRVPEDKVGELSEYYRSHDELPCKAYIVRPPCNPNGTSVTMDLAPPDFAKPERY